MTHFRLRFRYEGTHVHCRLFAGASGKTTHAKCGDLVMRDNEFHDFVDLVKSSEFEIAPELDLGKGSTRHLDMPVA